VIVLPPRPAEDDLDLDREGRADGHDGHSANQEAVHSS
jgi:hypothetical protein